MRELDDTEVAAIRRQLAKRWRSRDEDKLSASDREDTLVGLMAIAADAEGEAAAETLQAMRTAARKQMRLDDILGQGGE